jgi:hypothetical protein
MVQQPNAHPGILVLGMDVVRKFIAGKEVVNLL